WTSPSSFRIKSPDCLSKVLVPGQESFSHRRGRAALLVEQALPELEAGAVGLPAEVVRVIPVHQMLMRLMRCQEATRNLGLQDATIKLVHLLAAVLHRFPKSSCQLVA